MSVSDLRELTAGAYMLHVNYDSSRKERVRFRIEEQVDWFFRHYSDAEQYADRMTELIRRRSYSLEHAYHAVKRRALYA